MTPLRTLGIGAALLLGFLAGWLSAAAWEERDAASGEQAVEGAFREPSRAVRFARLARLGDGPDRTGPQSVVAACEHRLASLEDAEIRVCVDIWTRHDPRAAMAGVLGWKYPRIRTVGLKEVAYSWGYLDPLRAREAIRELATERRQLAASLTEPLIRGWARAPARQPELRAHLRELGPTASGLVGAAVSEIHRHLGTPGLLDWADTFIAESDPAMQEVCLRKTVQSGGARSPDVVASWLEGHQGEAYASAGPRFLAEAWVKHDPVEALDWIRTEAPEESQALALEIAFGSWQRDAPVEAREWIESVNRTEFHDPALRSIASRVAEKEPSEARSWCERAVLPETRDSCLQIVARSERKRSGRPNQANPSQRNPRAPRGTGDR